MDQPTSAPNPSAPYYNALEDPEQLKTLTIDMLLGVYDGHLAELKDHEIKIQFGMGIVNVVSEWKAQAEKYVMLRKTFRLDRTQAVLDIYRREIIHRMQVPAEPLEQIAPKETNTSLEDPEQLKTLTIEMLLGIYDCHRTALKENEIKIWLGMRMMREVDTETHESLTKKHEMLRQTFRLDRDQIVIDIYRREIIRRMQEKEKSS